MAIPPMAEETIKQNLNSVPVQDKAVCQTPEADYQQRQHNEQGEPP